MLKKKINGAWNYLSFVKKKVSGSWADCDTLKKYSSGAWSTVWQRIFTDWVFESTTTPYGFYSYSAKSTANGNIQIKAKNSTYSGNYLWIATSSNITLDNNETLYLDYSITKEGYDSFWEFSMWLGSLYSYKAVGGTGTISLTNNNGSAINQVLELSLHSPSGSGQYASATVDVSRIYTDSKVYYWNTKSIVTY